MPIPSLWLIRSSPDLVLIAWLSKPGLCAKFSSQFLPKYSSLVAVGRARAVA
jgi:hypothetical protein